MRVKLILIIPLLFLSLLTIGQGVSLGDQTTIWIGDQASFYVGGNTVFSGVLTNNGEIISESDPLFPENNLDFVDNINVGSLKFVGTGDQTLSGDSLNVENVEVDKTGEVILQTRQVIVTGTLNTTMGVIQAEDELDLLVTGGSDGSGQGFVEGQLVGFSTGQPVSFPMGVNGSPNYITLSGATTGSVIRVECRIPNPDELNPDEEIIGISEEVEWVVTSLGDLDGDSLTTDASLAIDFSGVDLSTLTNGEQIQADVYEPAIVMLVDGDSLWRTVTTRSISNLDVNSPQRPPTSGTIEGEDLITVNSNSVRLAIAYIPIVDDAEFYVPNSFAPAAFYEDNRVFRPFLSGDVVSSFSMSVYNSFNDEVYSVSDTGTNIDLSFYGWNGNLPSGQEAPEGVYYYRINIVGGLTTYSKNGSVLLVK